MIKKPMLPNEFNDLEVFAAEFALPTREARFQRRVESSMDQINAFYNAVTPKLDTVISYLDRVPLSELPSTDHSLLHLMLAYVDVSRVVEIMGAPDIHSGFDAGRLHIEDIAPI